MKRVIILLFVVLAGCKQEYPSIPHDVIPLDKMTHILTEMHIADAVATTKSQGGENEKQLTESYYQRIYKNYGITKQEYQKSYHFYESNPKLFNKMYDDILSNISKQEDTLSKNTK